MKIKEAIEVLKHYSGPYELTLHAGASEALIREVETTYDIILPADFKTFYRFTDGFEIDEDIFNMIPLMEMIGNKKSDEPVWIAEYMIYSDMWSLEIDKNNADMYSIFVTDAGQISLTDTLGEFIIRVLNNGVFEIGGLYHWIDEKKAISDGNTSTEEARLLSGVFYQCLEFDLIPMQHVIARANWITSTEINPHNFLVQISQCVNLNDLLSTLKSIKLSGNILQTRVIFGAIYNRLLVDTITTDKALSILSSFVKQEGFISAEINEIRYLMELKNANKWYLRKSEEKFHNRVRTFFRRYSGLNLYNHKNWEEVSTSIIKDFQIMN
jgi:hypothetical protein